MVFLSSNSVKLFNSGSIDAGVLFAVCCVLILVCQRTKPPGIPYTYCWLTCCALSLFATDDGKALTACIGLSLNLGWYLSQMIYTGVWRALLPYWEEYLPKWSVGPCIRLGDIILHPLPLLYFVPYLRLVDFRISFYSFLFERWYFIVVEKQLFGNGKVCNVIYDPRPKYHRSVFLTTQLFSSLVMFIIAASNVSFWLIRRPLQLVSGVVLVALAFVRTDRVWSAVRQCVRSKTSSKDESSAKLNFHFLTARRNIVDRNKLRVGADSNELLTKESPLQLSPPPGVNGAGVVKHRRPELSILPKSLSTSACDCGNEWQWQNITRGRTAVELKYDLSKALDEMFCRIQTASEQLVDELSNVGQIEALRDIVGETCQQLSLRVCQTIPTCDTLVNMLPSLGQQYLIAVMEAMVSLHSKVAALREMSVVGECQSNISTIDTFGIHGQKPRRCLSLNDLSSIDTSDQICLNCADKFHHFKRRDDPFHCLNQISDIIQNRNCSDEPQPKFNLTFSAEDRAQYRGLLQTSSNRHRMSNSSLLTRSVPPFARCRVSCKNLPLFEKQNFFRYRFSRCLCCHNNSSSADTTQAMLARIGLALRNNNFSDRGMDEEWQPDNTSTLATSEPHCTCGSKQLAVTDVSRQHKILDPPDSSTSRGPIDHYNFDWTIVDGDTHVNAQQLPSCMPQLETDKASRLGGQPCN